MKGKRYNEGKAPLNQIPAGVIRQWILSHLSYQPLWYIDALRILDEYQNGIANNLSYLLNCLSSEALEGAARVYEYGAEKYDQWNWTLGMKWSTVLGCMFRHMLAQGNDEESGLPHEWHAAANIIMLVHYFEHNKGENDIVFKVVEEEE